MPRAVSDGADNLDADMDNGAAQQQHDGYNVGAPPKKNLLAELAGTVKETFFSDEPMRRYKDQPRSRKLWLALQHVFPVFEWGSQYTLAKFKGDLIAGLTLASLVIPQDIGYAKLANLPPEIGLHSSFVPPLIYALMGTSRELAMGPVAVISLLLGTLLQEEIDPKKNPLDYRRLAFTATFFAGVTQAALGFCRLGFIIEFLSHAAIIGFMAGAAITIALQQLKGFLGIANFTKKTDIISVMKSVWGNVHHGGKKNKKLFWVPAIAPLISVIISTLFVYITRELIFANPGAAVIQKLWSAKFTELIGEDKICLTVGDAVKKFAPQLTENVLRGTGGRITGGEPGAEDQPHGRTPWARDGA